MTISISIPALLIPAIAIFFLAYANCFVTVANSIRDRHNRDNNATTPRYSKVNKINHNADHHPSDKNFHRHYH